MIIPYLFTYVEIQQEGNDRSKDTQQRQKGQEVNRLKKSLVTVIGHHCEEVIIEKTGVDPAENHNTKRRMIHINGTTTLPYESLLRTYGAATTYSSRGIYLTFHVFCSFIYLCTYNMPQF
jgi:hypothetical protein